MLLLLALLGTVSTAALPDPTLTPGQLTGATKAEICATRWGTDARRVTPAMKRQIFGWYQVPQADRKKYEVDHLIPRSAGGADTVKNLWPQPWPSARQKDRLETLLHKRVCVVGDLSLAEAREAFADWPSAYRRYVGVGR